MTKQLLLLAALWLTLPALAMEQSKRQTPLSKDSIEQQSKQYNDSDIVNVLPQGSDEPISITVGLANLSQTLKILIEDSGIDLPLPLPSVPAKIWKLIQEQLTLFLIMRQEFSLFSNKEEKHITEKLIPFIKNLDPETLVELLKAVNYLDIPFLYQTMLTCGDFTRLSLESFTSLHLDIQKQIIESFAFNTLGHIKAMEVAHCAQHTDFVRTVCVMGDTIVSGSFDGTIGTWVPGTNVRTILTGHTDGAEKVCATKDKIVSGSWDGTIRIWNRSTGQTTICRGHQNFIRAMHITGDKIVSGSFDKTIRVWDLETGEQLTQCDGHTDAVYSIDVAENKIASGSADGTIRIWDLATGKQLMQCNGHTAAVSCVCLAGDKIVSCSLDKTMRIWDLATGKLLNVCDQQISPETLCVVGNKIFVGCAKGTLHIFNLSTSKKIGQCTGHTSKIFTLMVVGDKIVSGSEDQTINVWDCATLKLLMRCIGHTDNVWALCMFGNKLVSASDDRSVRLWDMSLLNQLKTMTSKQARLVWDYLRGIQYRSAITSYDAQHHWQEIARILATIEKDAKPLSDE